jgi:hypothetical protein
LHIQISFLLAGKAGIRQIFGRRTTANGNIERFRGTYPKPVICVHNRHSQVDWQFRSQDCLPNLPAALLQAPSILRIESGQLITNGDIQVGHLQKIPICVGRNRKAVCQVDSLPGQLASHLSQRRILAANEGHILDADFVEPADEIDFNSNGDARTGCSDNEPKFA